MSYLNSLKQTKTPLNSLFFSEFNTEMLQRGIRQGFKNKTGIAIDIKIRRFVQSHACVFINNSGDHDVEVKKQVAYMNARVIDMAMGQIQTGVSQYIAYTKEIDTTRTLLDRPVNTSTTGNKLDKNTKIGIN